MNLKNPLVSIIVPAYNHENYIGECIESIMNQTYENIELIIINDGSKDKTANIIRNYESKCKERFKRYIFIDKENEGICKTLNRGIKESSGQYLCFLASDDMILSNKIEKQLEYFKTNKDVKELICNGYIYYGNEKESEIFYPNQPEWINLSHKKIFKMMLCGNIFNPFAMYNREIFNEIGFFNEEINFEDWDMHLRISYNYKIGYIDEPLFLYRRHENNITSRNINSIYYMYEGTIQTLNSITNRYKIDFFTKRKAYSYIYAANAETFKKLDDKMYLLCLKKSFMYLPFNGKLCKYLLKGFLIGIFGNKNFNKIKMIKR
ncbi:glycosyltransferase family A protein [Clostridium sp.]|uniref:glycosyltransferase family 2 protein n=1 Tax=Clostridium sp. TaxID=1506 RepID=UPI0026385FC1|nr:glycosyltransferase family A protein [Clostridium sp.]